MIGRYNSHLRRQEADLRKFMDDENLALDPQIDYNTINGLSSEVKERLFTVRPTSIVSVCYELLRLLIDLYCAGSCEEDGRNDADVDCLPVAACSTGPQASEGVVDISLLVPPNYTLRSLLSRFQYAQKRLTGCPWGSAGRITCFIQKIFTTVIDSIDFKSEYAIFICPHDGLPSSSFPLKAKYNPWEHFTTKSR